MLKQSQGLPTASQTAATTANTAKKARLWEIDFLRGVAIIMMIVYHTLWDLHHYSGVDVATNSGFWWYWARTCATLFVTLSGVSLVLNLQATTKTGGKLFPRILRRAAQVFGCGLIITAVTWVFVPGGVVWFGILHVIGLSMVVAYPFLRLKYWNWLLGVVLIFVGFQIQDIRLGFPWLVWLGLLPENFGSVDYFPFLPWFGVMLVGIGFGYWLNATYNNRKFLPDFSAVAPARFLRFLGRHSLLIYMLHQPVIITILVLLGIIDSRYFI